MHSLCLYLALASFFWLHNELFMCLSPLRADRAHAFVALPTPVECARHTRGSSSVVAGAAEEGVRSKDPPCALSSGSQKTCLFSGGQGLLAGQAPASCGGIWASGLRGKPGVSSGAVIYVAQPGCPWQAAPS